jgi:hypothetical protein
LEALKLELLLADHLEKTIHMGLLLSFELLVKLSQARGSMVMRVRGRGGLGDKTGTRRMRGMLASHLAWRGYARIVKLQVHKDCRAPSAGLGR